MPSRTAFRPKLLAAAIAGGMVGVALRELLLLPFTSGEVTVLGPLGIPVATTTVNVVGSFALGMVVAWLGDRRPFARVLLGTGVLGGFTTYSAFAVQSATLFTSAPLVGVVFALITVLLGLVAAATGVRLIQRMRRGPSTGAGADS